MKASLTFFSSSILSWFKTNGRDLPWRHTRDPYLIWLSEVILQQTRIDQGLGYWQRFARHWPTVEALAGATEDEVLLEWQGLGYYSRARNLLATAHQIVTEGSFPRTFEGLLRLRGVGPYTAAAIASFAYDVPVAVVDGNVYRVLARFLGMETPIDTTEGRRLFAAVAQEMLPTDRAAEYNQAIMDLGAVVCTPTMPSCLDCPLTSACVARCKGQVGILPVKNGRTVVQELRLEYLYIVCNGDVAIHRRGKGSFWQGLWELYLVNAKQNNDVEVKMKSNAVLVVKDIKHVLSHRRLLCDLYFLEVPERPSLGTDYIWVPKEHLEKYAKPRLVEILLERVGEYLGHVGAPVIGAV